MFSKALSTNSQQTPVDVNESTALIEEEKDIAGEMPNIAHQKDDENKENTHITTEKKSPKWSPEETKVSPSSKPNKRGLKLQLNVEAANRHNNIQKWSERVDLLTPASRGTPKRKFIY